MFPESSASKIGKSVGEKLRAARIALNYTQSQLAEPDFSVSYISAIERGQIHPSLRALEILATRLGMSSTQLLPGRTSQEDHRSPALMASTNEDEEEAELALFEAHVLVLQGAAEQAIAQLGKLSTRRLKRQQQIEHRYLLGLAYAATRQFQGAEQVLSEAVLLTKEANDQYLNIRIYNLLGNVYAAMRNYTQAVLSHQRCLNLLEEMQPGERDEFMHVRVYIQMGQHYAYQESYEQARAMFDKANSIADTLESVKQVQELYIALCQHYARQKEYTRAMLCAYKCMYLSGQEERRRLKGELHHYLGHVMMKMDQEEAHRYLLEASTQAASQRDTLVQATLATRLADWHFARHQLEEAEAYAHFACEVAGADEEGVIAAEALHALGRVEYALGRFEEGDRHFSAGLEMLERLGRQEEMVEQSAYYAQLLEQNGKEREAFDYFRRAFQVSQQLAR